MNDKLETLTLSKNNTDYPITLIYDKCKSGVNAYGPWHLYGVEYSGSKQGIFADKTLHEELKHYSKGTQLIIRRTEDTKGNPEWIVLPCKVKSKNKGINNANTDTDSTTKLITNNSSNSQLLPRGLDNRTRDIHRQVSLKLAVLSIGNNHKPWTKKDINEIKHRMNSMLEILEREDTNVRA